MGVDVHVLVEVSHRGEPWRPIHGMGMAKQGPRDYAVFAMLADVANRAGRVERTWQDPVTKVVDGEEVTVPGYWYDPDDGGHEPLVPISPPRGVPDDASIEWQAFVAMWQARGANPIMTYLTPEEILEADWNQPLICEGIVFKEDYEKFIKHGTVPETWASSAGGPGTIIVSEEEYAAGKRGEQETFVRMQWTPGVVRTRAEQLLAAAQDLVDKRPPSTRLRFMLLFEC